MSLITVSSRTCNLLRNARYLSFSKQRYDNVVVYELHDKTKTHDKPQQMTSNQINDVPGLSSEVVDYGDEPVGSGASKSSPYKNPEYFSYHKLSFYEAEIEMAKYRLPQPDSTK